MTRTFALCRRCVRPGFAPLLGALVISALVDARASADPSIVYGIPRHYESGGRPSTAAVGDFDGDGHLDVVATDMFYATVSVFLGDGSGALEPRVGYETVEFPYEVNVGDLDQDGDLDLVIVAGSGQASVHLNPGDGDFSARTSFTLAPTTVFHTLLGQVDDDGTPDLVARGHASGQHYLITRLGLGDGTFGPQQTHGFADPLHGPAIGDVSGDGHRDLVYGHDAPSAPTESGAHIRFLPGNGDGTFAASLPVAYQLRNDIAAIVDVTDDGLLDVVTGGNVVPNAGGGTFDAPLEYGQFPVAPRVADLDRDGALDVVGTVLAASASVPDSVGVRLGRNDGTFGPRFTFRARVTASISIGDLNEDGWPDLVTADASNGSVSVLLNATGALEVPVPRPVAGLRLATPHPNPSDAGVVMRFALERESAVTLRIVDVAGRTVRTTTWREAPAGEHVWRWDGATSTGVRAGPGIYFVELRAGGAAVSRRFVRIR